MPRRAGAKPRLELDKALATGQFGHLDGDSVRHMLAEASRLAEGLDLTIMEMREESFSAR